MLVHFSIAARPAVTDEVRELAEDVGDDRALEQLAEGVPARADLVGRFSPHTRVREGDSIEVAVDARASTSSTLNRVSRSDHDLAWGVGETDRGSSDRQRHL